MKILQNIDKNVIEKSNENFTKCFQNFQIILRKLLKYVENIYIFYKNFKENYVKILKKILQ